MRAVGLDEPVFFRRGEGAYLEDVEGRRYLDWVMSWGPLIFGHADEETLAAVVEAAAAGHDLRRADGGRGRAGRGDRRRRPVDRAGAPRLLGHRGVDERDPARPRLHEPRPHPPLRRLLPRPRRLAAGRRGLRRRHARHPVEPRRPDRRDRRHGRRAVQRRRGRGLGRRALRRGARGGARRAGCGEHGRRPARAGLPGGAARALRRLRRAARLRRGHHRLPRRPRRRAGTLRDPARSHHPGQDRRRRAAAGRVRRACRDHEPPRAGRRRLPGGDALRQPARDGGRPVSAAAAARRRRLRRARAVGGAAGGRA